MDEDGKESVARPASQLFADYEIPKVQKRVSERGELLKYFAGKLGWPIPRVARKLQGLQLPDLYYIKSAADSYDREGKGPWLKAFHGMLKPKNE